MTKPKKHKAGAKAGKGRDLVKTGSGSIAKEDKSLRRITEGNTGWYRLLESYGGAWQSNVTVDLDSALTYFATFACMTLIAGDIAKLRFRLVKRIAPTVWQEVELDGVSSVLRRPNPLQNRIQFFESYFLSKLGTGNTYGIKRRGRGGRVEAIYILDPRRVTPLVSPDGAVFYELAADNVAGIEATVIVPAREIIHDRFNTLFHPLVGMSPIEAAGMAAMQGRAIESNSAQFFTNSSRPGGVLTAPGEIAQSTVDRIKTEWETRFSGENSGKVAILGDGLKFEPMAFSAVESQMIEQAKWSADVVCSVFHVPRYKIGIGELPKYDSIQALNVEYYTQALQALIEAAELCLDEGLDLEEPIGGSLYGTEFDLDGLLRMDSAALYKALGEGVKGILTANEARARAGLGPIAGGDAVLSQQQNYSLEALAKRDAKADPFAAEKAAPADPPADTPIDPPEPPADPEKGLLAAIRKGFEEGLRA